MHTKFIIIEDVDKQEYTLPISEIEKIMRTDSGATIYTFEPEAIDITNNAYKALHKILYNNHLILN